MGFFNNKSDEQEGAEEMASNPVLEKLEAIEQRLDGMERTNRKFLMTVTLNDEKAEKLEKETANLRRNAIELLDLFDVIQATVLEKGNDDLKNGILVCNGKIAQIVSEMGLEEIQATKKMPFNPYEHESIHSVRDEALEDEVVVDLIQRGYKDKNSGNVLRCAKVTVNRL